MPLIIETLLDKYGHRTTLQAVAIAMIILTGPLIPFLKGRLPPSQSSTVARQNWSFARRPLFFVYCIANLAQGFGFVFPSLFLPSYATSIGLSARKGALLLALMSFAQLLGQSAFGILSDKFGLNPLLIISTLVGAVAAFTSWGFANALAPLIVFALFFGFFTYGFCSLQARMGMAVSEEPTAALATFGIFVFCQGVGNVLVGRAVERPGGKRTVWSLEIQEHDYFHRYLHTDECGKRCCLAVEAEKIFHGLNFPRITS